MKILALDPATHCGYAINYPKLVSGTWDLKPKRLEGPGMRYLRFRQLLHSLINEKNPEMVVFEEVRRHMGTAAAHVYGGLVAQLMALCEEMSILYTSVPVGTWKKVVLGKGNAKKPVILEYARKHLNPKCKTEDEADALCILEWAERTYNASDENYLR